MRVPDGRLGDVEHSPLWFWFATRQPARIKSRLNARPAGMPTLNLISHFECSPCVVPPTQAVRQGKQSKQVTSVTLSLRDASNQVATVNITNIVTNKATAGWQCEWHTCRLAGGWAGSARRRVGWCARACVPACMGVSVRAGWRACVHICVQVCVCGCVCCMRLCCRPNGGCHGFAHAAGLTGVPTKPLPTCWRRQAPAVPLSATTAGASPTRCFSAAAASW